MSFPKLLCKEICTYNFLKKDHGAIIIQSIEGNQIEGTSTSGS